MTPEEVRWLSAIKRDDLPWAFHTAVGMLEFQLHEIVYEVLDGRHDLLPAPLRRYLGADRAGVYEAFARLSPRRKAKKMARVLRDVQVALAFFKKLQELAVDGEQESDDDRRPQASPRMAADTRPRQGRRTGGEALAPRSIARTLSVSYTARMALGRREDRAQTPPLWVALSDLPSLLKGSAGARRNARTRAALGGAATRAFFGGAFLVHRLSAALGAALVLCNVAAAHAAARELKWTTPHFISQRLALQDGIEAPQAAPAELTPTPPPDDRLSARLGELIETHKRSASGPGVERIDALIREGEASSTLVYPIPRAPSDAFELLVSAYANGEEIWKELLELPRFQQAAVLQQAALWLEEYRELPPDQTLDTSAMLAVLPAPERAVERPAQPPKPSTGKRTPSTAESTLSTGKPTPSSGERGTQRARLLRLLEQGENEVPRRTNAIALSEMILAAYPQSGREMAGLFEALTPSERQLVERLVVARLLPLASVQSPTLQPSGVVEPVALVPSTMPTDPEQLLGTAYEWTGPERIERYRAASAPMRHAMRSAARARIEEAMRNAAEQAAAAAREQGTTPPMPTDPRLVSPEMIIMGPIN